MPQLNVQVRRAAVAGETPVAWVVLDGFLDSSTVLSFESTLEVLHGEERGDVVLDLSKLLYANSSAIGTILNYRNLLLEEGRELVLASVNPQVRATFDLLGLSEVVPCLPDAHAVEDYLSSAPAGQRDPQPFLPGEAQAASEGAVVREEAPLESVEPSECHVVMIVPEENRFTDIMRMRLATPHGIFRIVSDCTEALHAFDELSPDLVVLEDPLAGSDDFVWKIKTERGKSITPIIKLYWTGTNLDERKEFKIWEDDFLVEPFELMELFVLSERELRRIPQDRKALLHQTHFEFRTREANLRRANELAATFFQKAGLGGQAAAQLATGFAEALENAARHAHGYDPGKCIDVVFLLDREKLAITVTDEGPGFDWQPHVQRAAEASLDPERLRQSRGKLGGLGIALMSRCCDELHYLDGGNAVRLIKRL
ncbi:MAG: ATP-binding protein [Planctomycetota bacterium]